MYFLEEIYKNNFGKLSAPFNWDENLTECWITLYASDYKPDIIGNGLAWNAIVITYLIDTAPELLQEIRFESQANKFIMSSMNKEATKQFILNFKKTCENTEAFYKLIHKVNFTYTVKAVLDFWDEHSRQLHSGLMDIKKFVSLFI